MSVRARRLAGIAGMLLVCSNVLVPPAVEAEVQVTYQVVDIGALVDGSSTAVGINDSGQVVGSVTTAAGTSQAFQWQDGVITDLGTLGGSSGSARKINNSGQVVGSASTAIHPVRGASLTHAFLWQNESMTDLGTLVETAFGNNSEATAINDAGQVAGYSDSATVAPEVWHAVLWQNGAITDLGTLGGQESLALGINDAGQVVGQSDSTNDAVRGTHLAHAFRWQNGSMTDLGTLGGDQSGALAINEPGRIVGWAETTTGTRHAFLWRDGAMTDLGTLAGMNSQAVSINDAGQVVGASTIADNATRHAVLWQDGKTADLNDLIDQSTGWVLTTAAHIAEGGQIVGYGTHEGTQRAFLLQPIGCDPARFSSQLAGLVLDGEASNSYTSPLPGIRVQLWRDGAPVGKAVATDADGGYCIESQPGVTDPGSYKLRATLIDAINDPPLFETRYATETEATWTEIPVFAADFGSRHVDVTFTGTPAVEGVEARSWLPDVASIHLQNGRFMNWVLEDLGLAPEVVGPVTIVTFDAGGTSYSSLTHTSFISEADSPFSKRSDAYTECPENCEWHELAHHLANAVGIAPTRTAPACAGRTAHGGWPNATTCDSVAEGFASFLSALASLDIDAGRGEGYATADYSVFGSFEDNVEKAWTTDIGSHGVVRFREDQAFAKLLWDLADSSADENELLPVEDATGANLEDLRVDDLVALGGVKLVRLLIAAQPTTIIEVYDALVASSDVPADLKVRDPAFADTVTQDITPLQEAFLLHGFFPVHDPADPRYRFGDPIGRTDHVPSTSGGLVERRHIEELPGSAIRLVNSGSSEVTFTIDVTYPVTTSQLRVVVPPTSERLLHLEVPPPWRQVLAVGDALPACTGSDLRTVTITISSPGIPPQAMDSCAFLHAVATTTADAALTYTAAGSSVAGTTGGVPVVALIVAAGTALATAAALVFLVLRRRRSRS